MPRTPHTPSICLTMIVKNEAHVIARCLESVRPLITSYCVVDTGSSDGTQNRILELLSGIPGVVHERPWRDFGHNRTEAIGLARGMADYDLVIDADDVLAWKHGFKLPPLTLDSYDLRVDDSGSSYERTHLFRNDAGFEYTGVLHEVLISRTPKTRGRVDGLTYRRLGGGARSASPDKFERDARVLEAALAADPENARYVFYLAQSHRDAGDWEKARAAYARRATMGGWDEEIWYSLLECARITERLEEHDRVADAYMKAYAMRPTRAEPLCHLARYYRSRGMPAAGYPVARVAAEIAKPRDVLFLDEATYAWRSLDELAVCAYYAGRFGEGRAANERLLGSVALPASERDRVRKNLDFCRAKAAEGRSPRKRCAA